MSNIQKDQTPELIKETAKRLFFIQGRFDATTQEIAAEAGINRTLINYYFRSRDNLIKIIFEEAKEVDRKRIEVVQSSDLPFRDKIENFIEITLNSSLKYPYLEAYLVSEMNKGTCEHVRELDDSVTKKFFKEIQAEMDCGNIKKMEPIQFLLNMISLLIFPSAMRPLLMDNLRVNEAEFDKIISERKAIIIEILFKK